MAQQIREVVQQTLPPGATVLVVSHGDGGLLKLGDRRGWHFPRKEDGTYLGYNPDEGEAIDRLKAARDSGAEFLLFPSTECWRLQLYPQFKHYLDPHFRTIHRGDACVIFSLR